MRGLPVTAGIYLKEGAGWAPLRPESTEWRKEGLMSGLKKASGGLFHGEATGEIAGSHSSTVTHSPVTFLVRMDSGLTINDFIVVHLHGKHDNRDFKMSLEQLHSGDQVEFMSTRLGENVYQVGFAQGDGDYAFVPRSAAPTAKPARS